MNSIEEFAIYMLDAVEDRTFNEMIAELKHVPIEDLTRPELMHMHVLGFVQSRLATRGGRELRLHHWPSGARFSEEPHTHLWGLTSYVLSGAMRSTEYQVASSATPSPYSLFSVRQLESGTVREPSLDNVDVTIARLATHRAGEQYRVAVNTYHTSEPASSSALTLITTTRAAVERPRVAVMRESDPVRFGVAPMTPPSPRDIDLFRDALRLSLA